MAHNLNSRVGRYSAIAAAVTTALFGVSLVMGLVVHSSSALIMGYVVCILLAVSVVGMMAGFYLRTEGERRIFALLALAASILYAPFCMETYYLQLSIVASNPLGHPPEVLKLVAFVPGSPTFALDMFGYTFLCLSTLAAAFALRDPGDRALRVLCLIHGALAVPTVAAPIVSAVFGSSGGQANDIGTWVLLFWCVLFTPIAVLFARVFRDDGPAAATRASGPAPAGP